MWHRLKTSSYSLFCGVQELVLAAAAVTDPDAQVSPEAADRVDIAPLQLGDLHRVYILQPLGVDLKDSKRLAILGDFVPKLNCKSSKPE